MMDRITVELGGTRFTITRDRFSIEPDFPGPDDPVDWSTVEHSNPSSERYESFTARKCREQREINAAWREIMDRIALDTGYSPPPPLGGNITPQEWLRSQAKSDRKVQANARAREAEAIAAWLDTFSPPPEEDDKEKKEDEKNDERDENAGDFLHSRARTRVRDELENILFHGVIDRLDKAAIVDRILDRLIERAAELHDSYDCGMDFEEMAERFLENVKEGAL